MDLTQDIDILPAMMSYSNASQQRQKFPSDFPLDPV